MGEELRVCMIYDASDTGARLTLKTPEDVPDFFFHAPPIARRPSLQAPLHFGLNVPNNELSHSAILPSQVIS